MICCPCFGAISSFDDEANRAPILHKRPAEPYKHANNHASRAPTAAAVTARDIQAQSFTFRELATATKHFTPESLVGEGGRGRVYKGLLENGGHGQAVAIKKLDRNSMGDAKEFLVEVLMLSLLRHPNLVSLIGYCADGDQRLLVYELMPSGSLHDHLHCLPPGRPPLDWCARMRIASGAAQGLEYLHDRADPPVVCRDLKSSGILLDGRLTPKLSDFGHASLGPTCGRTVSRAMSTYGYSAPEYARNGELTMKSDVYSFGVVLLELITGRRALDPAKPTNEQNLVSWAQPMFKEQRRYPELVDPVLRGKYPLKALNQAVAIAAMCLQDEALVRPLMADVVITISFLTEPTPSPEDHVVETLQLGRSKRAPAPKPVSRCSSTGSSSGCSDDGSTPMHSQGSSSSGQESDGSMRSARADESD